MSHKNLFRLFLFFICSLGVMVGFNITREMNNRKRQSIQQREIHSDNFDFLRSTPALNKNTILTLFHPSCDFCQADAEQFLKARKRLTNLNVLWVSYDEKDSIQKFSKTYGLDSLSNMYFAHMDIDVMLERYGNVKFPTFLAYNKQGQLVEKFIGLTKPEKILAAYQIPED